MRRETFLEVIFIVAHEFWLECGKPEEDEWFAKFLQSDEETFTLVVFRCAQVLCQKKGQEWILRHGLVNICHRFISILHCWS